MSVRFPIRLRAAAWLVALAPVFVALAACDGSRPTQPAPIVVEPTPSPAPAPTPAPTVPAPRLGVTRILAFGDSMTEGVASPPLSSIWHFRLDAGLPRSYPFKLQTLITARYTDQAIEVFNAGLAGQRAAEDLDRFNHAVSEARPNVILLMEGANDLNAPRGGDGENDRIRETVGAVEDMVRSAGRQQLPVFVATLPPQRAGGPKAGAAGFLDRYNEALKAMAANKGAHVVDVFAQVPVTDIGADGLHPTENGYQHIAEIWLEALKAHYETAGTAGALSPAAKHPDAGTAASHVEGPAGLGLR
ncbi:MAG: SGNH/GDSL hydrolase family protein [Vicinamibacterales bacterium]